jgi:hypothetical protein
MSRSHRIRGSSSGKGYLKPEEPLATTRSSEPQLRMRTQHDHSRLIGLRVS